MYVTRPLSLYQTHPELLSLPPPGGPSSGILVVQDEESEATTCFGGKDRKITSFPICQNKDITIIESSGEKTFIYYIMPIPVLNQPLSLNLFYVTKRHGKHRGEAYTSSNQGDHMNSTACCFSTPIKDVRSRPLDPLDIFQQFCIFQCGLPSRNEFRGFDVKSVVSDGLPPTALRGPWNAYAHTPKYYVLREALGIDATLRARLPNYYFPLSYKSCEPVIVGKWYCPFIFIKDGDLKVQSKISPYYEMTLEQTWEQIFTCENDYNQGNVVTVDIAVEPEVIMLSGIEALCAEPNMVNGVIWYKGNETSVGLHGVIFKRMKWEQERVGWSRGDGKPMVVKRVEAYGGQGIWRQYGCYILVERFVLKRSDQTVALTYGFRHTHQINRRWE